MPVPKQKTSRKRRGDRRRHLDLKPISLTACSHCGAKIVPHRICPECGYYKGREVVREKSKTQSPNDKSNPHSAKSGMAKLKSK